MKKTRALAAAAGASVIAATLVAGPVGTADAGGSGGGQGKQPAARVLIVLFDQMLPRYADQFNMPNFRRLRDQGTNFKNAYLGYMASETVIAHNVIPSGLLPKNMGYTDEAYRDDANRFGKGKNAMHITGDLSLADFVTIQKNHGKKYPKLADYLHKARPGTKFITVGEKSYAVETATGASGDIGVRLSSRNSDVASNYPTGCRNLSVPGIPGNGAWRMPDGKNVPSYLTRPDPNHPKLCGRFFINSDSNNDYGTAKAFPSWMYPSDGNRYWPGNDPAHLGGDTWVADAAVKMMKRENWSGMFVTMGAIDKAAHMWGAMADKAPKSCNTLASQTHVKCAAENADRQLGKLLAEVKQVDKQKGGKTLVVLTADHGATYGQHFYGKRTAGAGDSNWYYAPPDLGVYDAGSEAGAPDTETYSDPSNPIKRLNADGNVQFSYQSTAIESWLINHSTAKKQAGAANMLKLPGVIASYWRQGDHFVLHGTRSMTDSERAWWKAHAQQIVDSMAAPNGPDVIGLEHDRSSYGVFGDHGGAQQTVQRVPMVFWAPGMKADPTGRSFQTPDVMPTVLKAMGIHQTSPTDGQARWLP
jgi:arylsulfatase A-like enzyme